MPEIDFLSISNDTRYDTQTRNINEENKFTCLKLRNQFRQLIIVLNLETKHKTKNYLY